MAINEQLKQMFKNVAVAFEKEIDTKLTSNDVIETLEALAIEWFEALVSMTNGDKNE